MALGHISAVMTHDSVLQRVEPYSLVTQTLTVSHLGVVRMSYTHANVRAEEQTMLMQNFCLRYNRSWHAEVEQVVTLSFSLLTDAPHTVLLCHVALLAHTFLN